MTNNSELYCDFEKDLKTIKSLRLSVIPAKYFYQNIAIKMGKVFLSFFGILIGSCFLSYILGWWDDGVRAREATLFEDFLASFCIAAVWSFISYVSIRNHTIFKYHFYEKLKTSAYLERKIFQLAKTVLFLFSFLSFLFITAANQGQVAGGGIFASIITFFVAFFLINAEISRIGINPLSHAIANYFEKNESEHISR